MHSSQKYFENAYNVIFEISVKLAQVLWRKVMPADLEKADQSFNDVCFNLLVQEKFDLACVLLDFASNQKKLSDDRMHKIFLINNAQAYKWVGNQEKANAIIDKVDWTATSDDFQMARAVIKDDFETVYSLMRKMGTNGPIVKPNYRIWPLFRKLREIPEFQHTFSQIFQEPLFLLSHDEAEITQSTSKEFMAIK